MAKKNINYTTNNNILQPEDSRRIADSTEEFNEKSSKQLGAFLTTCALGIVGYMWKDEIAEKIPVVKEKGKEVIGGVKKFGRKIMRKKDPVFGDVETLTEEE